MGCVITRDEPYAARAAERARDLLARWEVARAAAGRLSAGQAQHLAEVLAAPNGMTTTCSVQAMERVASLRWGLISGRTGARPTEARATLIVRDGAARQVASWDAPTFETLLARLASWLRTR
jgi:hypothetical protein